MKRVEDQKREEMKRAEEQKREEMKRAVERVEQAAKQREDERRTNAVHHTISNPIIYPGGLLAPTQFLMYHGKPRNQIELDCNDCGYRRDGMMYTCEPKDLDICKYCVESKLYFAAKTKREAEEGRCVAIPKAQQEQTTAEHKANEPRHGHDVSEIEKSKEA